MGQPEQNFYMKHRAQQKKLWDCEDKICLAGKADVIALPCDEELMIILVKGRCFQSEAFRPLQTGGEEVQRIQLRWSSKNLLLVGCDESFILELIYRC